MFLNGGILGVFPTCSEKNNTNACLIILIIFLKKNYFIINTHT
jgi:hypothetical protein